MDFAEATFLFLDCQTTGLNAKTSDILEMGWSFGFEEGGIETTLLKPGDETKISKTVWSMTGIREEETLTAPPREKIWKKLVSQAKRSKVSFAVIHYAQFEMPFLRKLHEEVFGKPLPWKIICTYQAAKRIYPDLPAKTLRAVSGHLGFVLPETHRSRGHIAATQNIWRHLISDLSALGVNSWEDLQLWLAKPLAKPPKKTTRRYLFSRQSRLNFPKSPGIYEMFSSDGKILYVGKATCLHNRVNSYFRQKRRTRTLLPELMSQVADIRVTPAETTLEAAILENDRIKELDPPYNISLRQKARSLFFSASDLSGFSSKPSRNAPWGPFISLHPFESLELLRQLNQGEFESINPAYLNHPAETLKRALDTCLTELGIAPNSVSASDLLRAGRRLLPRPEPEDEVEASIHRKLKRLARALHHTRLLCWLTDCRIAIRTGTSPWRFLKIRQGKIVSQGYADEPSGTFERREKSLRSRQAHFDIPTYDRMRILVTELSSLRRRKNASVVVQLSSRRTFTTESHPHLFEAAFGKGDRE